MKHLLLLLLLLPLLVSCATPPGRLKTIDTTLDAKATLGMETIGLNSQEQAYLQEVKPIEQALQEQRAQNYDLNRSLEVSLELLGLCHKEMADPRLGGKEFPELPDLMVSQDLSTQKEEMGLENGKIKVVTRELLLDRVAREKAYEKALILNLKKAKKLQTSCELAMGQARVKAGLPFHRFKGEGYYLEGGNYHQTAPAEHSLDDAFAFVEQGRK
jgi:hypothetical protein